MARRLGANRPDVCTYRARVLTVIELADLPLTGLQVAQASRLAYKQAIDALNALHNHGRVARVGSKFTARWAKAGAHHTHNPAADALSDAFKEFFK